MLFFFPAFTILRNEVKRSRDIRVVSKFSNSKYEIFWVIILAVQNNAISEIVILKIVGKGYFSLVWVYVRYCMDFCLQNI